MRLGDLDALKEKFASWDDLKFMPVMREKALKLIDDAQAVELDESVIQEVLNKRCMTAVANDYLVALHGNRPQGEWARHDKWVGGEYVGGFYHVNCPIEDGYYSKWRTNFCPNCGQPMMKEDAE